MRKHRTRNSHASKGKTTTKTYKNQLSLVRPLTNRVFEDVSDTFLFFLLAAIVFWRDLLPIPGRRWGASILWHRERIKDDLRPVEEAFTTTPAYLLHGMKFCIWVWLEKSVYFWGPQVFGHIFPFTNRVF